ncbi:MAG: PAS domain-containing protein [Burkholderiales bacterium]|nr:PAS domain-containing protein [Burkholderiales bacterium]
MFDVLEAVGLGVWDWNLVTRRAYVSPALKALYGYGADEVFDLELDALTHSDDLPAMHRDRQAHWDGLTPFYKNEHRVRHKAGHWIWVLTRGLVVQRDAQGKPLRMTGFHVDVTARKQAELQHTLTCERLELALQGTHDGLWDWDLVADKLYCSPRFMALLHYTDEAEFNEVFTFRAHLHPDDLRRVTGLVRAHTDGDVPGFDAEYRLRCRGGGYRWFHGRGMVARSATGQAVRFAGHITDITDRIAADEARQALQAQLRDAQKQEALGLLASGVARDFSQLLGAAQTQIGHLKVELADQQAGLLARVAAIEQATGRADTLARQMLAFSRQQPHHMVVLDVCAVVSACLDTLQVTLPPGVALVRHLATGSLKVLADAAQICQLLGELWRNACQSFAVAGGTVHVRVAPDAMGHGVTLAVQDDGQGMPPEVQARAFEPFFSTRSPGAGPGLGLPAVQAIVLAHQGRITLDSAPGRGTQVEVWLPVVASLARPPLPVVPNTERLSAHGTAAGPAGHIVYIDDYEAMVYLITRMLRKRGCRVSAFERADDALALVKANPADVDLLVTDYNMPGLSGLDVVRQVKAWRADLPIVITSGHVTPAMTAEALAEGVLQVLNKHDSVEAMADQLAAVLARLPARH